MEPRGVRFAELLWTRNFWKPFLVWLIVTNYFLACVIDIVISREKTRFDFSRVIELIAKNKTWKHRLDVSKLLGIINNVYPSRRK